MVPDFSAVGVDKNFSIQRFIPDVPGYSILPAFEL
jgi:hypothetical protein